MNEVYQHPAKRASTAFGNQTFSDEEFDPYASDGGLRPVGPPTAQMKQQMLKDSLAERKAKAKNMYGRVVLTPEARKKALEKDLPVPNQQIFERIWAAD